MSKRFRFIPWLGLILISAALTACAAATPTPPPSGPTATERPFPTFGPTRTRTPTRTPRPTQTPFVTATRIEFVAPTETASLPAATKAPVRPVPGNKPSGINQPTASPPGRISRAAAPALVRTALIKAGVNDPKVYWFTFDEGSHEEALMVQYSSPLRWQAGYAEMLRAAKQILGQYYLQIDPPLYTAFVVATDLTGTSDAVQRLRRFAPEKLARGEIDEEDFLNNYFEPEQVVISCQADGSCTGKMATPFPVFNFPFPFPFPTPTP